MLISAKVGKITEDVVLNMHINLKDKTFVYELAYVNKKKLYEVLYGTTNNYRRLHGGHALREVAKRRYIMRHKR